MKDRIKTLLIGMLIGALLVPTAFATVSTVTKKISYNNVKITLDGKTLTPTDANGNYVEPFIMDGTTYLPVRGVANALGLGIEWDGTTNTVKLSSTGDNTINPNENTITHSDDIDEKMAEAFLSGELNYVDSETKDNRAFASLRDWGKEKMGRYTLFDLDADNDRELLIEHSGCGDIAIIDMKKGACTAYYITFRGMHKLKTDGTMLASGGASYNELRRISSFTGNDIEYYTIAILDSMENNFIVNGKAVTEEKCREEFDKYEQKESVEWIPVKKY